MRLQSFAKPLLIVYWIFCVIATHVPPSAIPNLEGGSDKILHFIGYCGLGTLFAFQGNRKRRFYWIILMIYGALDEITQPPFGRSMELGDWICDAIGSGVGVWLGTFFKDWLSARETGSQNPQ